MGFGSQSWMQWILGEEESATIVKKALELGKYVCMLLLYVFHGLSFPYQDLISSTLLIVIRMDSLNYI